MGVIRSLAILLCAMLLVPGTASGKEPGLIVDLRSMEVFQGEVAKLRVVDGRWSRVEGRLGDQPIPFFPEAAGARTAFVGVDLQEQPGTLRILVKAWTDSGGESETILGLKIKEKPFPQESLSVPAEFDHFSKEVLDRIRREQDVLSRLWRISTPQRFWEGRFVQPVSGGVTSPFGLRRVINGAPRSPHGGVDLKAAAGTPVVAANHGKVVLRADFFFSGKSLVLDHGGGLYTMYFHLADFKVAEGVAVRRGDLVGTAGMTGRVTGPHLHWGARLNGARVDPFELIETLSGKP